MSGQLESVARPRDRVEDEAAIEPSTSDSQPVVRYEQITKRYGTLDVIKGIDLTIRAGEKIALIGPSGSGKTTLGRMLMTLEEPTGGRILIEGESLWEMPDHSGKPVRANARHLRRMRGKIGMIFQHFNLFPHLSVLDNVTLAPRSVLALSKEESRERAVSMLGKVGLEDKLDAHPARLSGGQKQRVAIARALVMQPKIMVFDEVTSALDPELVGEVLEVIKEIAVEGDMAMMLITHEMDFAKDVADRVIFGDGGLIVEEGPPEAIFERPQSERLQSFLKRSR